MNKNEAIGTALEAVEEAYNDYKPLHDAYIASMQNSGHYEAVPGADEKRAQVALTMMADGELTSKGIARAVEAGLIHKVVVAKSDKLLNAEKKLLGAHTEYTRVTSEAVAMFQVKTTKGTRSKTNGDSIAGLRAVENIKALDPEAKIYLDGRRVMGTLSNGVELISPQGPGYDFYAVAFQTGVPEGIRKVLNKA